ncbi:MAG: CPBP family intramembrane glutamic endopeptidase [Owenweeksia sp.]|nr:CPBP family intramembrane glutamic endopeptidase [Owenweeksia sp.]
MQPLLGVWFTSVIFVALHGYLSISNWRIGVYGLIMLGIIAGFGYLYRYTGLLTVITAHSVFDFVLFMHIYRSRRNFNQEQAEEELTDIGNENS